MATLPKNMVGAFLALIAFYLPSMSLFAAYTDETIRITGDGIEEFGLFSISLRNRFGQVAGNANRYDSNTRETLGSSAWLYTGDAITRIGLLDAGHTDSDGSQYSTVQFISDAGQAVGSSRVGSRFYVNSNAWLYSGGTSTKIGIMDAIHTSSVGYQNSDAVSFNEAGQVVGNSSRYDGPTGNESSCLMYIFTCGSSAWIYSSGNTTRIGLFDVNYTADNGYQNSAAKYLNEAGQVAGTSEHIDITPDLQPSTSAWLYSNGMTARIGLIDDNHTSIDGRQSSNVVAINNAGQVAGHSSQYNSIGGGNSAWLYSDGVSTRIGLTSGVHNSGGNSYSTAKFLNEAGQVAGVSDQLGYFYSASAWMYSDGTTARIGLTDAVHTKTDGSQYSDVSAMNNAGQVVGFSSRFDSFTLGNRSGASAWLYSDGTTTRIGLTGAIYTGADGVQYSNALAINNAGQVAGFSSRFDSNTVNDRGITAWLFDSTLEKMFAFDVSVGADGYSSSRITHLGDDGLVLGYYHDQDSAVTGINTLERAFAFTVEDGFVDLLQLVTDDSPGTSLSLLEQVYWNKKNIIGFGFASGVYIENKLVNLVPIPAATWLFCSGLLGMILLSKRKINHPL